jgi:hypothetical protein
MITRYTRCVEMMILYIGILGTSHCCDRHKAILDAVYAIVDVLSHYSSYSRYQVEVLCFGAHISPGYRITDSLHNFMYDRHREEGIKVWQFTIYTTVGNRFVGRIR